MELRNKYLSKVVEVISVINPFVPWILQAFCLRCHVTDIVSNAVIHHTLKGVFRKCTKWTQDCFQEISPFDVEKVSTSPEVWARQLLASWRRNNLQLLTNHITFIACVNLWFIDLLKFYKILEQMLEALFRNHTKLLAKCKLQAL